jgi:hypothetical protein
VEGNTMKHIGLDNNFLNGTPIAQKIKERMNDLRSFCTAKETVLRNLRNRMGKNFASDSSDKGLMSRIYRESPQKNQTTQ